MSSVKVMNTTLDNTFLERVSKEFKNNPIHTIAKNAVTSVGAQNAALDNEKANKVSHVFLNTLKPHNLRVTNQENSGRCWMFAGLNIYRYLLIRGMNLERFEFSETYLFFYDKLERANWIIQYFIDNPEATHEDREVDIMLKDQYSDGGYWNFFSNLVDKYGLVPRECMDETFHSGWTDDMNNILKGHIISCVNKIIKCNQTKKPNVKMIEEAKSETIQNVYNCLVKFLGEPPKNFDWYFEDNKTEKHCISKLTPHTFYDMVKAVNVKDFVVLINNPDKDYYKTYKVRNQNNMLGGDGCVILNLPIEELKKYASKSIMNGLPVWFAGDVNKGFGYHKSVLNEDIYNTELLFGKQHKWSKADKLRMGYTQGNHAMTITGVNYEGDNPVSWQVENSWGYYDHELPGLDGFLSMSDSWFNDNLIQIVVNKNFLSRTVSKCFEKEPLILEPWDYMAPALKVN